MTHYVVAVDVSGSVLPKMILSGAAKLTQALKDDSFLMTVLAFNTGILTAEYNMGRDFGLKRLTQPFRGGGGSEDYDCVWKHLKALDIAPDRLFVITDGVTPSWGDPDYCLTTFVLIGDYADRTHVPYGDIL